MCLPWEQLPSHRAGPRREEKEERRGTEDNQDSSSDETKETGRAGSLSDTHGCWGPTDGPWSLNIDWGCTEDQVQEEGHVSVEEQSPKRSFTEKKKNLPPAALVQKINNS